MKPFSVFLFMLFSLGSFGQDENKFEKFHTGRFTYEGEEGETIVKRSKKRQVEVFNKGKSKLVLKISWTNDSTYVLVLLRSVRASGCLKRRDWIEVTITSCTEEKYTYVSHTNNCGDGGMVMIKL